MLRILHDTRYDFIRAWRMAVGITVVFIVIGLATFVRSPILYSIDFTGGTLVRVHFNEPPKIEDLRAIVQTAGIAEATPQQFGSDGLEYTIRARGAAEAGSSSAGADSVQVIIRSVLTAKYGVGNFTVLRSDAIGPRVGAELKRGALLAILFSFVLTLLYLAWRFEWRFGLAAVLATAHDILATLAFIKLMDIEVSLEVIAAILTVIGYSLNDTIIIFDRVRENLKKKHKVPMYDVLNRSINETLPRSVMTHGMTLATTLALLFIAGPMIRPFAWVMAFGIFTGTFSSIYIAGPTLLYIERRWPRDGSTAGVTKPAPSTPSPSASGTRKKPVPASR